MTDFDQRKAGVDRQNIAETINQSISFEQYKAHLEEKRNEIRDSLVNQALSGRDKAALRQRLAEVQKRLIEDRDGYQAHIKDLEERVQRLDELQGKIPDKLIKDAKQALTSGDHEKADNLFSQVIDQGEKQIEAVAETSYQRGKLAEDEINYHDAYRYLERSAHLAPDNTFYLSEAGTMAGILAMYDKAIEYYELALVCDLKTYGENHPQVATCRNNLGLAWRSLGDYERAIEYYELALASGLKTYGEDHPDVAIRRNNLGLAWYSLGEYHKAIEYYELALASGLKTFGEDHPKVAIRRNNLGAAWDSLGEYLKAIEYYELALASGLKTYGEDHPKVAIRRNNLGAAWRSLGEYERAIEYYELVLATLKAKLGDSHPHTLSAAESLARVKEKIRV